MAEFLWQSTRVGVAVMVRRMSSRRPRVGDLARPLTATSAGRWLAIAVRSACFLEHQTTITPIGHGKNAYFERHNHAEELVVSCGCRQ